MTLHHYPHQAIDGTWHAVYRTPGCDSLTSMAESASKSQIVRECDRLNREQAKHESWINKDRAWRGIHP